MGSFWLHLAPWLLLLAILDSNTVAARVYLCFFMGVVGCVSGSLASSAASLFANRRTVEAVASAAVHTTGVEAVVAAVRPVGSQVCPDVGGHHRSMC